jgi:hypothetical protein
VEFRLIYDGPLPPDRNDLTGMSARATDKHRLRKHFHVQLRELWKQHPDLRRQAESHFIVVGGGLAKQIRLVVPTQQGAITWLEYVANTNVRCNGNRFVPLISEEGGFTCSLDILFLRRDNPGGLIQSGGDIDNRIKVLFDGLRMPIDVKELGGLPIESDEDPFFCLLEDDKLVTRISVTTDRLITPPKSNENIHDVLLVIHVTVVNPGAIFTGDRLV